ncbi:hypothetical protein BGZ65_004513, partial [Modicella reniformis]
RNSTEKPNIKAEVQDRNKKWVKIAPNKTYSVVTVDFVLNGGDNIFLKANRPEAIQLEKKQDQVMMDAVKKAKVIKPLLDGRIRDIATPLVKRSGDDVEEEEEHWPVGLPEHMKWL